MTSNRLDINQKDDAGYTPASLNFMGDATKLDGFLSLRIRF
jgi:hypothetical protein